MAILDSITTFFSGGFAKEAVKAIEAYFPPDLNPEKKAQIELAMENFSLQKQAQFDAARQQAEKDLNDRIAMYEGSASDLKSLPVLGSVMLFLRGAQRPVWGFATLYLDYGVFSGLWKLNDPLISNAFWVVNFLVLGFLFGERAVTNIMPFMIQMTQARQK